MRQISGKRIALAEEFSEERDYWLNKLAGDLVLSSFPADYVIPSQGKGGLATLEFKFTDKIFSRLIELSNGSDYTLHMILMAGFLILLKRFTGNSDIIVGMPVYKQEIEGEYLNTVVVLRNQISPAMSFKELLLHVRENSIEAEGNQNYPLETLTYKLNLADSHGLLFDTALLLKNVHEENHLKNLRLNSILSFERIQDFIQGVFQYRTTMYKKSTIERIIQHYQKIINTAIFHLDFKISDRRLFPEAELNSLISGLGQPESTTPEDLNICQLFEEQVNLIPEAVALVWAGDRLTYRELNQRSNQVARFLQRKGIKSDDRIGLMMEPSLELVICMLGIIKTGAAYIPIDPTYPLDRVNFILEDAQCSLVITEEKGSFLSGLKVLSYLFETENIEKEANHNLDVEIKSNNLLYIIYTSGSTGTPKGVLIEHKAFVNLIWAHRRIFKSCQHDRISQIANLSFDACAFEVWPALTVGAELHLADQLTRTDPELLKEWLVSSAITIAFVPTPLGEILISDSWPEKTKLKSLLLAGDQLHHYVIKRLPFEVYNLYGPTETTVWATYYKLTAARPWHTPPIGKPIDNVQIYILDDQKNPVPFGVKGDIYIGGAGLARGYNNRPELDERVFVNHSDLTTKSMRLYRTGDLGCSLPDGNIIFAGRQDFQVKIRGFRIELQEIETVLQQHPSVKKCILVAKQNRAGDKQLVAYLSFIDDQYVKEVVLQNWLKEKLPAYMVPDLFVILTQMPVTHNGKIDRKALPDPDIDLKIKYVPPENDIENSLVDIWSEILEIEQDEIGIDDNFFEMGGHSLKATTFVARVSKKLDVKIQLSEVFEAPTIRELAKIVVNKQKIRYSAICPVERSEYYPLSSAQKRLFVLEHIEDLGTSYNSPNVMIITGKLDVEQLMGAFKEFISRHESLRTSFALVAGQPVQRVHEKVGFHIDYQVADHQDIDIEKVVKSFVRPFDLRIAPLLRVKLIRLPERINSVPSYLFIFDMHHIISDGVSLKILIDEIVQLYQGKVLPDLRIQYRDFAVWQNKLLAAEEIKKMERYWLDQFRDKVPLLNLPTDFPRPVLKSYLGDKVQATLSKELTLDLNNLAQRFGTTLYMVLLAVFHILLSKYSGQKEIVIGSPIAGRHHADLENIVGIFINTLVMRTDLAAEKTFRQFLSEIKKKALEAYEHQDYQFESLVEKLDLERDMGRHPIFDVMFAFQNFADDLKIVLEDLEFRSYDYPNQIAKFDLNLHAMELDDQIYLSLNYAKDLFANLTVQKMLRHYTNIVKEIIKDPEIKLSQIPMLTAVERQQVIDEFNMTKCAFAKDKTLKQVFEEQVRKTPEERALIFQDKIFSYREVNKRANQLAGLLRERGVKADTIVGLMVERSLAMMIGILAIFKAGGAYLPIDPAYPEERIQFILEDSKTTILLTNACVSLSEKFLGEVIDLSDQGILQRADDDLDTINLATDLAYLIYTSGSTGMPKGVMVEQHAVINTISDLQRSHPLNADDIILQSTVFTFDASGKEIFWWFFAGASLYLLEAEDHKYPHKIVEVIHTYHITKIRLVPILLNELINAVEKMGIDKVASLKYIFCSGAAITKNLVQRFYEVFPRDQKLYTTYGPTETTLHCTKYEVDGPIDTPYVLLGRPISNDQIYILDDGLQPVPIGVTGEIYIGGVGVARGYYNNLTLNQEMFIENPFLPGEKMYRSGDLGRWHGDGNIEFLGRIDNQFKIRGFRIEPGEIENQLLGHQLISQVVVITNKDDHQNSYIVAYLVGGKKFNVQELRVFLATKLPDYMIPAYFIQLDRLPLTHNGKVNYPALPKPDGQMETGIKYLPPRNDIEERLVKVWREILAVNQVGINDNFYSLGGDSIKAIQIASKLNHSGLKLEIKDLFKYNTISELSGYIKQAKANVAEQGIVTGPVQLTPIQREFFDLKSSEKHHYNQSVMFYSRQGFQEDLLKKVWTKIIQHHDGLRLIYQLQGDQINQFNRGVDQRLFDLKVVDLTAEVHLLEKIGREATLIQRSIDLATGPLVKLGLFKTATGDHLLIVVHHLVIDGVSWRILLEDITTAYQQASALEEIALPSKTTSFKTWADQLKEYAQSRQLLRQVAYWKNVIQQPIKLLPKDRQVTRRKIGQLTSSTLTLEENYTRKLLQDVHNSFNTEINDLLLAALAKSIKDWTGEDKILISLEGHGREEIISHVDITRTIGWFTTRYPVVIKVSSTDLSYYVKSVKEGLRKIPQKGIGYGILKFLAPKEISQEIIAVQNPEISFNYLGQFGQRTSSDLFTISDAPMGAPLSPEIERDYVLDIIGVIERGQLVVNFRYNRYEYKTSTIERVVENFEHNLKALIDHCLEQTSMEITPTDLGDESLSIEDLDNIFQLITEE